MYTDAITVVHPVETTDRYGNITYDYDAGETTTAEDVAVQPEVQQETGLGEARATVITGWRVYTAPGRDLAVHPVDRVRWNGLELDVVGEVARWADPLLGTVHHVEFAMQRRSG